MLLKLSKQEPIGMHLQRYWQRKWPVHATEISCGPDPFSLVKIIKCLVLYSIYVLFDPRLKEEMPIAGIFNVSGFDQRRFYSG
jgi:hypothetical protein